jgi:predicted membrane-bound mannosyltransferase
VLTWVFGRKNESSQTILGRIPFFHSAIFVGLFVLVAFLLFSSFFQNMRGPLDSILSFQNYFVKAGDAGWHAYPWNYYLKMLTFSRYGRGPVWSEALILTLAVLGAWASFKPSRPRGVSPLLGRFLAFFTLLTTAVYSIISYKTPWNLLPFYLGMILLAGIGAAYLIEVGRSRTVKSLVGLFMLVGILHLSVQCYQANFKYYADVRNPYVYAHTSSDLLRMVERIQDLSRLHLDGKRLLIKVVTGPYEAWPLPWYLRHFERVGYWNEIGAAGFWTDVPLVISTPPFSGDLEEQLQTTYQTEFYGLRPEVPLILYIEPGLWDRFMQQRRED